MEKQKPGEYKRSHDGRLSPSLKDLGIENHSSHDERSVLKLNDLGIEESVVTRCHHTQNGFNHRWTSPWLHDATTGQCTKAGRPTEITSSTMEPVLQALVDLVADSSAWLFISFFCPDRIF